MDIRDSARNLFDSAARLAISHPVAVTVVALLIGVLGFWRATGLKVDSDFRALVPGDFPSVQRIDALEARVGSLAELIVEIRSPDREANIRFGDALAQALERLDDRFHWVEVRRETSWFRAHALLFLPLDELLELRDRLVRRIRREVTSEVVADLGAAAGAEPADDPLDLDDEELESRYGEHLPTEYLEAEQDGEHLLVVRGLPIRSSTDMGFAEPLAADVDAAIAQLDPKRFHPQMQAALKGEYNDFRVEMREVRNDIFAAGNVALGLLLLVLVIQFKRFRSLPLLALPLVISVLATVAVATVMYDALNLIAGFIFVVLLGIGIDYGIHMLSRYEFERRRGRGQQEALRLAARTTGLDVAVGAGTSVVVFLLFTVADFRGYAQFGALAAVGVTLALVFTILLMPALIVLIERVRTWKPRQWLPMAKARPGSERRAASIITIVVSVALAAWALAFTGTIEFEYDLSKLGKALDEMPDPDRLDFTRALGRPDVGPAMAMADDPREGEWVNRQARGLMLLSDSQVEALIGGPLPDDERLDDDPKPPGTAPELDDFEEDEDDPFAAAPTDPFADLRKELAANGLAEESRDVLALYPLERVREMRRLLQKHASLWSFLPRRQEDKLRLIADMRARVEDKWEALKPETRERAKEFRRYLGVTRPIQLESIPEWIRLRWTDASGNAGRNVVFYNRGNKSSAEDVRALKAAFFDLAPAPGDPTAVPVAASYFVLPDIVDAVVADGPRILGAAFLGVLIWLLVLFRSIRIVTLVLIPLAVGIAWLIGLFELLDWKVNIYNMVTFAVLIGIGVDNGVHMVSRWIEDNGSVTLALRETAVAIATTSITTAIGFGGLMVGGHRGLSSLGWTAAIGILLCMVSSVATLPALLHIFGARRRAAARAEE